MLVFSPILELGRFYLSNVLFFNLPLGIAVFSICLVSLYIFYLKSSSESIVKNVALISYSAITFIFFLRVYLSNFNPFYTIELMGICIFSVVILHDIRKAIFYISLFFVEGIILVALLDVQEKSHLAYVYFFAITLLFLIF